MEKIPVYVIIVAAGSGSRYGSDLPKQFCMMAGKPVLCHTIERVRTVLPEAEIVTVVSPRMHDYWEQLAAKFGCEPTCIVNGGATRWESVKNALKDIERDGRHDAIVLVHDAARPLLDTATARAIVGAVAPGVSVVPVLPVTDSLRYIDSEGVSVAVERSRVRSVVTPQGFLFSDLMKAYELPYDPSFTDDASVMAAAGMPEATLIDATPSLIKITGPAT